MLNSHPYEPRLRCRPMVIIPFRTVERVSGSYRAYSCGNIHQPGQNHRLDCVSGLIGQGDYHFNGSLSGYRFRFGSGAIQYCAGSRDLYFWCCGVGHRDVNTACSVPQESLRNLAKPSRPYRGNSDRLHSCRNCGNLFSIWARWRFVLARRRNLGSFIVGLLDGWVLLIEIQR
jgi:hypothetical protein